MIDRLRSIEQRHRQIQEQMALPEVTSAPQRLMELGRELHSLEELVSTFQQYQQTDGELSEARELLKVEKDSQMQEFLRAEERTVEGRQRELMERLKLLLLPKDRNDDRDVVVEIQGAEGGAEAGLFAGDLFRMY
ncbi:MAG: PCRF domain-containing protein, partial [Candidatus Dormibacteraceae bacterium]